MFLKDTDKNRSVTKKNYKKQILKTVMSPAFTGQSGWEYWDDDELFQEDNAPIHETQGPSVLKNFKQDLGIRLFN